MTTLIGIVTNHGEEGIVMASDRQATYCDEKNEPTGKGTYDKIVVGRSFALAHAGDVHKEVMVFKRGVAARKTSAADEKTGWLDTALNSQDQVVAEVLEMNRRLRRRNVAMSDLSVYLLAAQQPKLLLRRIDEYGNLMPATEENEFEYIALGSGEDAVDKFIDGKVRDGEINPEQISLSSAIDIAYSALTYGTKQDLMSGGPPHLVVLTKKGIRNYDVLFENNRKQADQSSLEQVKNDHGPDKPTQQA